MIVYKMKKYFDLELLHCDPAPEVVKCTVSPGERPASKTRLTVDVQLLFATSAFDSYTISKSE